jgi:hypothetical protein
MPDFWEFPTVSMGLGPINAVYQARFNRYLLARQIKDTSRSHVWAFLDDGETDEPEVLGPIGWPPGTSGYSPVEMRCFRPCTRIAPRSPGRSRLTVAL